MLGTITIKLFDITVDGYFPPPLSIEEPLIANGTGVLTISFHPVPYPPAPPFPVEPQTSSSSLLETPILPPIVIRGIRYYLEVTEGKRVNPLRLGQMVAVSGRDAEKKLIALATPLETIATGEPAVFSGPIGTLAAPF